MKFELAILDWEHAEELSKAIGLVSKIYREAGAGDSIFESLKETLAMAKEEFKPPRDTVDSPPSLAPGIRALARSPFFDFWSTLSAGQTVRWSQHPNAIYTVVSGERVWTPPDEKYRVGKEYTAVDDERNEGLWIELRRKSGKTFWCHIAQVRPLTWTPD